MSHAATRLAWPGPGVAPPFCSRSQYCDACIGFSLAHRDILETVVITHKPAHQRKQNQISSFH